MRTPQFQHQADEFWQVHDRATSAVERRRSHLLALLAEGKPYKEALELTGYSYQGADKVIDAYHERGLAALSDRRHHNKGAPTLLSDEELLWLAQRIRLSHGRSWTGLQVQQEIKQVLGKTVHLSRCYEVLEALGHSKRQNLKGEGGKSPQKLSQQWQRVLTLLEQKEGQPSPA